MQVPFARMSAPPPGYPTGGKPADTSSSAYPDQKGNQPGEICFLQMRLSALILFSMEVFNKKHGFWAGKDVSGMVRGRPTVFLYFEEIEPVAVCLQHTGSR